MPKSANGGTSRTNRNQTGTTSPPPPLPTPLQTYKLAPIASSGTMSLHQDSGSPPPQKSIDLNLSQGRNGNGSKLSRKPTTNTIRKGLKLIAERDEASDYETVVDSLQRNYSDREGVTLSWRKLNYVVDVDKEKKQVLWDLNGQAKPGELLAILGGSGAGSRLGALLDSLM